MEKYYMPLGPVWDWLERQLTPDSKVLEIGPGNLCFPRSQVFVDCQSFPNSKEYVKCNILHDNLPFADKEFDFVYCRHVLEDLWYPVKIMEEMSRVAKAGYLETPSPIAEMTRGVDAPLQGQSEFKFRGYHHHHWIIWVDDGVLKFITKYPLIEHMDSAEDTLRETLKLGPHYWNTYYYWTDRIDYKIYESPIDFRVDRDYAGIISKAVVTSATETRKFWESMKTMMEVAS